MTTIAAKNNILAADKKAVVASTQFPCTKLYRCTSRGSIIGVAGSEELVRVFLATANTNFLDCEEGAVNYFLEKDRYISALELTWKGEIRYITFPPLAVSVVEQEYYAIGDGGDIALGALASGKTPVGAIQLAAKINPNTGMGIDVWTWEQGGILVKEKVGMWDGQVE